MKIKQWAGAAVSVALALGVSVESFAGDKAGDQVARGRYLVTIGGCNDCHTDGYLQNGGNVPEDDWLLSPYLNTTPALDQLVIYRESAIFYEQGLQGLIEKGYPLHPPLIYILINIGFRLFGTSILSYNLIGLSFFFLTFYLTLKLLKDHFSISNSLITTLLLLTNSIILLNYIYLSNDALILTGRIASLYFFQKENSKV